MSNQTSDQNVSMERSLRAIDLWSLALGAMIGWGCFVLPGNAFLEKAGPLGTAIGMAVGALMIVIISLSYTYLIQKFPVSGGAFVYADAAFGKTHAFICGWFLVLTYWCLIPLNGTAVGLVARFIFPGALELGKLYQVAGWDVYAGELIVAILSIIILAWVNVRGVKFTGGVQTGVALGLVGSILLLVVGVLLSPEAQISHLAPLFPEGVTKFQASFAVAAMAPWAFIGFDCIPQAAGEYRFSQKKTILIMVSATIIAALMYVIVNTVTAIVMPWQDLIAKGESWPTGYAVEFLLGRIGLMLIGLAMLCAVISGLNAFFLSASRVMYTMANADALPAFFGKLDPVTAIPKNGIIFLCALAVIAPFFGRQVLVWIVDMTSVGASLGFLYTCASALVIAKRQKDTFNVVIGLLGTIFSVLFLGLLLVPGAPGFLSLQSRIALVLWVVIGIFFYLTIRTKYRNSTKLEEMVKEVIDELDEWPLKR